MNVFDLTAEKTQKKKVSNCCGILRESLNSFLIMDGEAVLRYELEKNKLQKAMDTEPYTDCVRSASGQLYLLCKGPIGDGKVSSKILAYPSAEGGSPWEIVPGEPVQHIALSQDETQLFLVRDNCFWLYSIPEERTVFRHTFDGAFIFEDKLRIFDKKMILTYRWSEKELTCWQMEG